MPEITAVIQHASLGAGNIHVPYDGVFADESARLAAQLDTSMEGKLYRQLSDNTLWMLVSASGASWVALGKATAKYLGKGGDDNQPMTFFWQGQNGQPSWVWGGSDGKNMYVYNPANFSVAHATTAESLTASTVELLTVSGTYQAKNTGPHWIIMVGGGGGGCHGGAGGAGGGKMFLQNLTKGQNVAYVIGAGGAAGNPNDSNNDGYAGGDTSFNGISVPGGKGGKSTVHGGSGGSGGNAFGGSGQSEGGFTSNGGSSAFLYPYGNGGNGRHASGSYEPIDGAPGTSGAILIIK